MAFESTIVEKGVAVSIAVPIRKDGINTAARTVRGIATQEVVDAHGEEVDYASVKAAFGTWRGNIREMHERKAVGRAIDIAFDDTNKAVEVEAYISLGAEDTWLKVQDGTLGFYSIGGVADRAFDMRSDGSRGTRLIMRRIDELSLVDSGACPTATISVVKLIGGNAVSQLAPMRTADLPMIVKAAVTAALAPVLQTVEEQGRRERVVIAKLEDQLHQLASAASGGRAVLGPNCRMAEKPIGGVVPSARPSAEGQLADEIAKLGDAASEADRRALVEKMLAFQFRTGAGGVFMPHGQG
jgi:hypothetical protein